jgi:hypothetical protein
VATLFAPGEPEWRRRQAAGEEVQLSLQVANMLVRFAHELGISAAPLDDNLESKESRHAQA